MRKYFRTTTEFQSITGLPWLQEFQQFVDDKLEHTGHAEALIVDENGPQAVAQVFIIHMVSSISELRCYWNDQQVFWDQWQRLVMGTETLPAYKFSPLD